MNCWGSEIIDTVCKVMESKEPTWISRIGGTDTSAFGHFRQTGEIRLDNQLEQLLGYFDKNTSDDTFVRSAHIYEKSLQSSDIITVGNIDWINRIINRQERTVFDLTGKTCTSFSFIEGIDPFFFAFERFGQGKKILIISPFSKSIQYQTSKYRINRILNMKNGQKFPDCEFKTYSTPITYNMNGLESLYFNTKTEGFSNWIELADKMINDISLIDFDIALIASGIYTMYLGHEIKTTLNKKAIFLGGMLNPFFNIYSPRYDTDFFNSFQNLDYQISIMEDFGDLTKINKHLPPNEGPTNYLLRREN